MYTTCKITVFYFLLHIFFFLMFSDLNVSDNMLLYFPSCNCVLLHNKNVHMKTSHCYHTSRLIICQDINSTQYWYHTPCLVIRSTLSRHQCTIEFHPSNPNSSLQLLMTPSPSAWELYSLTSAPGTITYRHRESWSEKSEK